MVSLSLDGFLTAGLMGSALLFAVAVALVLAQRPPRPSSWRLGVLTAIGVHSGAAAVAGALGARGWDLALTLLVGLVFSGVALWRLPSFTLAGALLVAAHLQVVLFGTAWALWFLLTAELGVLTRGLLLAGMPFALLLLVPSLVEAFEQWEVLCRWRWDRPRGRAGLRTRTPMVSLHVPTYSEPPDVVMATLDALARVRYPDFEVLVIDNNTKDPALWRPVEAHCQRLTEQGKRFRFFHLDNWPGAKAGALNFALEQTAPRAEVIGVIDSDYQADPDFLNALIGYFDDSKTGFVQTAHDYRAFEERPSLRACYWEYRQPLQTTFVARNERNASLIIGTMCLIRRRALTAAGGWAEWCVCEDSELAIRIQARGFDTYYVPVTLGRGLIPDTFAGYKKQRFRWTFGPIQQFRRHWRLFLPAPLAQPSALTAAQKLHHLVYGVQHLAVGPACLLSPLAAVAAVVMVVRQEVVVLPPVAWVAGAALLLGRMGLAWTTYRHLLGCSLGEALGASLARLALGHTVTMASLRGLMTGETPWVRTSKFRALPAGLAAVGAAHMELLIGGSLVLVGLATLFALPTPGLHLLLGLELLNRSLGYLAAPALAVLADWDLRASQHPAKGQETNETLPLPFPTGAPATAAFSF